jgi:hypothetical protein
MLAGLTSTFVLIPLHHIQRSKTPKFDLNDMVKRIFVALSNKKHKKQEEILDQIKEIVAGTHSSVSIQAPKVKHKTKGRPAAKDESTTSTKQYPSTFEHVEKKLKVENNAKKQQSKGKGRKATKQIKKIEDDNTHSNSYEKENFNSLIDSDFSNQDDVDLGCNNHTNVDSNCNDQDCSNPNRNDCQP